MKRNNKKGFTIVELVIVIAVIAILAGVLIPTFASIVRKANISADTSVAKNLNTALVAAEAEGNKPANFSDVLDILQENGYIVANLNPTTEGCFFVWESESNQIILVDKNFKVLYAGNKELKNSSIGSTWYFAVNDSELLASLKEKGAGVVPSITSDWIDGKGQNLVNLIDVASGEKVVITLNEALTLNEAPVHSGDSSKKDGIRIKNGQTVDFNLAGQTLTADFVTTDYRVFQVQNGTFNLSNGVIVANGVKTGASTLGLYGIVNVGGTGTPVANITNMDLTYTAGRTEDADQGGSAINVNVNAVATVKDSTISVSAATGVMVQYGKATLDNVTIKSTTEGTHIDTCISVAMNGELTINSGNYTSADTCFSVLPSGGKITVKGGLFSAEDGTPIAIYKHSGYEETASTVIEISGGTFQGKAWNEIGESEWMNYIENMGGANISVVKTATNVTITVVA